MSSHLGLGIISFLLAGAYSWIMTATSGEAASWAWLLLVVAAAVLGIAARAAVARRAGRAS